MRKKKGFTLIELLAVIVILAIIALIAVPVIMNIINSVNKSAFKDTAYGVIQAGELYFAEQQLEPNGMLENVTITLPDDRLQLKGEIPKGTVQITKDGKIAIAVQNERYCVTKGLDDKDVTISENVENCVIPVKITNMTVTSGTDIEVGIGISSKIEVSFEPLTATNTKLNYISSDESVLTIDEDGNITGVSSGSATITIETTDGSNITETINVTVKQSVESLDLGTTTLSIVKGDTYQIVPTITPDNASNKELTYASSKTSVATVDSNGLITAVAAGSATITVTTTDGSNISKTISVTVKQLAESITLDKETVTVGIGLNDKVTATVLPSNTSNKTLTWTSSDTSIATVSSGTITGVALGTTTVTVTTTDGTNISKTVTVNVVETYENGIMQSIDNCINTGTCNSGTAVKVAVSDSVSYKFYVLADDGDELTLIMNQNLGGDVAWISKTDYATANTDGTSCTVTSCNDEGPVTAINALTERTSSWTNIEEKAYTISGLGHNGTTQKYEDMTVTSRARMLTYAEATSLGCTTGGSCPSWLYENNSLHYWTSTPVAVNSYDAWSVSCYGHLGNNGVNSAYRFGVRPVISLSKSAIQ